MNEPMVQVEATPEGAVAELVRTKVVLARYGRDAAYSVRKWALLYWAVAAEAEALRRHMRIGRTEAKQRAAPRQAVLDALGVQSWPDALAAVRDLQEHDCRR